MHYKINTKYYFINNFDTNNIDKQDKKTIIIYRNYKSKKIDQSQILKLKNHCKKKGLKFYLSNNIKTAIKLRLDGAYIPSFNKNFNHLSYTYNKYFKIIGSAHNEKEIVIKRKQGCRLIFLSPIFNVKKKNYFLNISRFNLLTLNKKDEFIALGGINLMNVKKLCLLKVKGFAGISFFQKKTAP